MSIHETAPVDVDELSIQFDATYDSDDEYGSDILTGDMDTVTERAFDQPESGNQMDVDEFSTFPRDSLDEGWAAQAAGGGPRSDVHERVKRVLSAIHDQGFTLATFLHAFSWGTPECVSDNDIKNTRTAFMNSAQLPTILYRWWKVPRSGNTRSSRSRGARSVMENFAVKCLKEIQDQELDALADTLKTPANSFVENNLTEISMSKIMKDMETLAPTLWNVLYDAAYTEEQKARGNQRRPDKIIMMVISMLSYSRNQNCNALQKLFAMYFKFNKISARAFDCLHGLGITMGHTWVATNIERAADHAMAMLIEAIIAFAWFMSHDNVNIPFEVYSQRLDNKSHFDSGTAATVFVLPGIRQLSPQVTHALHTQRQPRLRATITASIVLNNETIFSARLVPHLTYRILYYLLQSPAFNLQQYQYREHASLRPSKPLHELPAGQEHIAQQFLLQTKHIEEASYEGNNQLLLEWIRQMCLDTPDEKVRTALDRIIVFIGDQLTSSRMRGLFKIRAEDINSFHRYDFLVPLFGWLHLLMAFANSLHKQYYGTTSTPGLLTHAFSLLSRKGLTQVSTKGPFYHDLCEAIEHVLEAHILVCWLQVSGVKSLAELRSRTPIELTHIAKEIFERYALRQALDDIDALPVPKQNNENRYTCSIIRDLLHFSVLKNVAVKEGDVGIMESMLPYLLARFVGGKNSNYSVEVLELMQGLWVEWPTELAEFVRTSCWLVNFSGKRDSFLPIDLAQEHNIRDIKVTYRPDGPSSGWDYISRISPAIPAIRSVSEHVGKEMKILGRGKKHANPSKEADVKELMKSYATARIHDIREREPSQRSKINIRDFVAEGFETLQDGNTIPSWVSKRQHQRSNRQKGL